MPKVFSLSFWRCACGVAWIFILGIIGLTVAEISHYGGIVQFYGDSLVFTWNVDPSTNHYRVLLTKQNLGDLQSTFICSTLYCQEPNLEILTIPGYFYKIQVQAVSPAGNISEFSEESSTFLCLGNISQDGSAEKIYLVPTETTLGANYPNPFNASTTIPYTISSINGSPVAVSLKIYNTLGRIVKTLVDEDQMPGQYRTIWDGHNDYGTIVSTGTYICLLRAGEFSFSRTMVYVK
jgi:hypothetical protein